MRFFLSVYSHPEFYPPALNAIDVLSGVAGKITVLSRNVLESRWDYPAQASLVVSGPLTDIRAVERKGTLWKILSFLRFTGAMWRLLVRERQHVVLLQDAIPLFAFYLVRRFLPYRPLVWYHNHDVIEKGSIRKYSVSWFALVCEEKMFRHLDIFSLPATERQAFFPMDKLKGKFYFLPNLPRKAFYNAYYQPRKLSGDTLQLLYQGEIGRGHGFEELIPVLQTKVRGRKVHLNLIGPVTAGYRQELADLAVTHGVAEQVRFFDKLPYRELPAFTRQFDVGLAIHKPQNAQYATGGTASNKIYEYAALGLPVLLYDDAHYRRHLGGYQWTFFTNLGEASIGAQLEKIVARYADTSRGARNDFMGQLNFETYFNAVLADVLKSPAPAPAAKSRVKRRHTSDSQVTQPPVL
jgi:glycosyltransferase involved in cell wall biosynthesis